jgi:hypothetical protein
MREPRAADARLVDLRHNIADAFDEARIDKVTELLSANADLWDADSSGLSKLGVPDYRTQVRDVIGRLREEGTKQRDREDIGRRLGLVCFAHLILASLLSVRDLTTGELIDAAVSTGYRDLSWTLAVARQLTDPQEKLDAQLALASRLPTGPQRLSIYDDILKQQLPRMAMRTEQYEATERLVEALPRELLPELHELAAGFTHDHFGARPRALAVIATRCEEPDKSKIIAEALQAARQRPDTWGHAMTVLAVLPQVPRAEKRALQREFLHAVSESLRSGDEIQFEDLTRLADVNEISPRFLLDLITTATGTQQYETGRLSPDQRDRLLAAYAERLALRHRAFEAFQVVRAIPTDQGRATATWLALQAMNRGLLLTVVQLPGPALTRWQQVSRLVWAGLVRTGPAGRWRLRQWLLAQAMALDGDDRTAMLWNLLPYLPDDLANTARAELGQGLAATDTANPHERRQVISGLANLAAASPEPDRKALVSRAFELAAISDDDERRSLAAQIHRLLRREQQSGRAALIESMDMAAKNSTEPEVDFARLPEGLVPLAWETPWAREPRHFRQFGVLASRMAAHGPADVVDDRLSDLVVSLRPDALAELLECLPVDLLTTRLFSRLIERWAQLEAGDATGRAEEDYAKDLGAIARIATWLPDAVVHAIVEWDQSARPQRRSPGYKSEEIAACLAPLYARAGYLDEAQAMAAGIAAHHEKARALAGIAAYLPEHERLATAREALTLARSVGDERVQTEYHRRFAEALMKLVGATRFGDIVADTPDARALATIADFFPPEEATGVWHEAIEIMSGPEILDFVHTMPDTIARDAIASIVRRSADDYSEFQAPTIRAIFARIGKDSPTAQFDRLIDFMSEAANHGRPALISHLEVVTPLLLELGGDVSLNRLQQAIYRVATWWP